MIHDVDESVRDLLLARVVQGASIDVSFDLPDQEWAARRQGPALNVYLYDIREDLERRQVQYEPQYDTEGIVTSRRMPPRRFKLEYMITAWAQRSEDEHRLLGVVMQTFLASDEFPAEHLRGSLAGVGPIRLTLALPLPDGRSLSDVWGVLGGGMRPVLDLSVTVPMGVREDPHVGPPVLEGPKVEVLGPDGRPVGPIRRFADAAVGQSRPDSEVPPGGAGEPEGSTEPGDRATSVPTPAAVETREVIDAARFRRGSQVRELGPDDLAPGRRMGLSTMPRPER